MSHDKNINLLAYKQYLKLEIRDDRQKVFDPIRKRWFVMLPEEFVRQLIILFIIKNLNFSDKRIAVEKQLIVDGLRKRFDIVVFDKQAQPYILVECKAPEVSISDDVALQIAQYNKTLKAQYLWLSNGSQNLFYKMDYNAHKALAIVSIPGIKDKGI
ncbi:MAG: type I restriction enzyme HsdR N-terminal domain-containing protein [Saprospiraceae bacterium]